MSSSDIEQENISNGLSEAGCCHEHVETLLDCPGDSSSSVESSVQCGLVLDDRLTRLTDHVDTLNTLLSSDLRPALANCTGTLVHLSDEMAECRWRMHFSTLLVDLWQSLQRLEASLRVEDERLLLSQPIGSLCEQMVELSAAVDQLCCDTDNQLTMAYQLQQQCELLRVFVKRRLTQIWRSIITWNCCHNNSSEDLIMNMWRSDQLQVFCPEYEFPVMIESCNMSDGPCFCVELRIERFLPHQLFEFLSALRSLGILEEFLQQLGDQTVTRLLKPLIMGAHTRRYHIWVDRSSEGCAVIRLIDRTCTDTRCIGILNECDILTRDEVHFSQERSAWSYERDKGRETPGRIGNQSSVKSREQSECAVEKAVVMIDQIVDVVRCLYELVCCESVDHMSVLWMMREWSSGESVRCALANCALADQIVTAVSEVDHREIVVRLVTTVGRSAEQLLNIGFPEDCAGLFGGLLFLSCDRVLDSGHLLPSRRTVDDILLNCICAGRLSQVARLAENVHSNCSRKVTYMSPGSQTIASPLDHNEIGRDFCEGSEEKGQSLCVNTVSDCGNDFSSLQSIQQQRFSVLDSNGLFLFPSCQVWACAPDLVDLMRSTLRLVTEISCSCNELSSPHENLADSSPLVGCDGDICIRSLWRERLSSCVQDSLQLFVCFLRRQLSSFNERLQLPEVDVTPALDEEELLRICVSHNSCHFVAHKSVTVIHRLYTAAACETAVSHTVSADTVADISKCAPWLDIYIELRQLAVDWLNTGVELLDRQLVRLLPSHCSQLISTDKLDQCVQLARNAQLTLNPPVLPAVLCWGCVNRLVCRLLDCVCRIILRQTDISTVECDRLTAVFDKLLLDLNVPPLTANKFGCTASTTESWRRFEQLHALLSSNLSQIVVRWQSHQLSLFSSEQVRHLVRVLFRNTEHRMSALQSIR